MPARHFASDKPVKPAITGWVGLIIALPVRVVIQPNVKYCVPGLATHLL